MIGTKHRAITVDSKPGEGGMGVMYVRSTTTRSRLLIVGRQGTACPRPMAVLGTSFPSRTKSIVSGGLRRNNAD